MKKFLQVFLRVLKAFTLEEKVLSVVFMLAILFFGIKSYTLVINPAGVFAESGVYTEGIISTIPVLLNPLYVDFSQANRDVSSLVFSGLLKYDPKLGGFVDDLASLKISEDKKEYVFTIKDNVLWHDERPFTADDVIFTYGFIQAETFQNPLLKANFLGVKIEQVGEKTVKFSLARPNSFFITNFNVGILPKHILGETVVTDLLNSKYNLQPIGTGPYKVAGPLQSSDDGKQRVVLNRFEGYYSTKPKINEVRFNVYPDEDSLLREKSSINILARVSNALTELIYDTRFKTINYALPQYNAVFLNTQSKVLKSTKVRIALLKSLDKDALVAKLDNRGRIDTPLMGLNQKDWINTPDQKEANGALYDAGYQFKKDEKGQILAGEIYRKDKAGKELELTLIARAYDQGTAQNKEVQATLGTLVDSWTKIGVKTNLSYLSEIEYLDAIRTKQYDMILAGQSMGYNLDTFPFWHSSQVKEDGLNLSNYRSFAADQEIEKIRETFDKDEKETRQKQLAKIISKEVPAIFLYRPNYLFLTDGKVQNINLDNLSFESDRFVNIADWCIGKDCK